MNSNIHWKVVESADESPLCFGKAQMVAVSISADGTGPQVDRILWEYKGWLLDGQPHGRGSLYWQATSVSDGGSTPLVIPEEEDVVGPQNPSSSVTQPSGTPPSLTSSAGRMGRRESNFGFLKKRKVQRNTSDAGAAATNAMSEGTIQRIDFEGWFFKGQCYGYASMTVHGLFCLSLTLEQNHLVSNASDCALLAVALNGGAVYEVWMPSDPTFPSFSLDSGYKGCVPLISAVKRHILSYIKSSHDDTHETIASACSMVVEGGQNSGMYSSGAGGQGSVGTFSWVPHFMALETDASANSQKQRLKAAFDILSKLNIVSAESSMVNAVLQARSSHPNGLFESLKAAVWLLQAGAHTQRRDLKSMMSYLAMRFLGQLAIEIVSFDHAAVESSTMLDTTASVHTHLPSTTESRAAVHTLGNSSLLKSANPIFLDQLGLELSSILWRCVPLVLQLIEDEYWGLAGYCVEFLKISLNIVQAEKYNTNLRNTVAGSSMPSIRRHIATFYSYEIFDALRVLCNRPARLYEFGLRVNFPNCPDFMTRLIDNQSINVGTLSLRMIEMVNDQKDSPALIAIGLPMIARIFGCINDFKISNGVSDWNAQVAMQPLAEFLRNVFDHSPDQLAKILDHVVKLVCNVPPSAIPLGDSALSVRQFARSQMLNHASKEDEQNVQRITSSAETSSVPSSPARQDPKIQDNSSGRNQAVKPVSDSSKSGQSSGLNVDDWIPAYRSHVASLLSTNRVADAALKLYDRAPELARAVSEDMGRMLQQHFEQHIQRRKIVASKAPLKQQYAGAPDELAQESTHIPKFIEHVLRILAQVTSSEPETAKDVWKTVLQWFMVLVSLEDNNTDRTDGNRNQHAASGSKADSDSVHSKKTGSDGNSVSEAGPSKRDLFIDDNGRESCHACLNIFMNLTEMESGFTDITVKEVSEIAYCIMKFSSRFLPKIQALDCEVWFLLKLAQAIRRADQPGAMGMLKGIEDHFVMTCAKTADLGGLISMLIVNSGSSLRRFRPLLHALEHTCIEVDVEDLKESRMDIESAVENLKGLKQSLSELNNSSHQEKLLQQESLIVLVIHIVNGNNPPIDMTAYNDMPQPLQSFCSAKSSLPAVIVECANATVSKSIRGGDLLQAQLEQYRETKRAQSSKPQLGNNLVAVQEKTMESQSQSVERGVDMMTAGFTKHRPTRIMTLGRYNFVTLLMEIKSQLTSFETHSSQLLHRLPIPLCMFCTHPYLLIRGAAALQVRLYGLSEEHKGSFHTLEISTKHPELWLRWMLLTSHLFPMTKNRSHGVFQPLRAFKVCDEDTLWQGFKHNMCPPGAGFWPWHYLAVNSDSGSKGISTVTIQDHVVAIRQLARSCLLGGDAAFMKILMNPFLGEDEVEKMEKELRAVQFHSKFIFHKSHGSWQSHTHDTPLPTIKRDQSHTGDILKQGLLKKKPKGAIPFTKWQVRVVQIRATSLEWCEPGEFSSGAADPMALATESSVHQVVAEYSQNATQRGEGQDSRAQLQTKGCWLMSQIVSVVKESSDRFCVKHRTEGQRIFKIPGEDTEQDCLDWVRTLNGQLRVQ